MSSPFPCSPVIRECQWKKAQIEKIRLHYQHLVDIWKLWHLKLTAKIVIVGDMYQHHENRKHIVIHVHLAIKNADMECFLLNLS